MKLLFVVLVAAGLLTFVATGKARGQRDEQKTEAKGTLTLGDNTYKLARALAYEVTRSNRKQTVVILSEKTLDTAKLRQSLKKNGTDEGFFPFDAHVKLRFDDKGKLLQTDIIADGANIIGSGDDNVKVTATIKDGTAKGKAGMEKPAKFFKKSYQFEVTFDVAVLQAPGAGPEPKAALDPKTKPKTTTTPGEPGKAPLVTEKELRFEGKLTKDSPEVLGKPSLIHRLRMTSDKTYMIDLESADFDTYLRILDSSGKQLASDDDGGDELNSRLRFTPPNDDSYQIVATSFGSGQGDYLLKIRALDPKTKPKKSTLGEPGQPLLVTEKGLRLDGELANDSPMVQGKPAVIHHVKMSPDKTYLIDLESSEFDPYLRILDAGGKQLASDDDGGEKRNARLRFTPLREGNYQVVATRFGGNQGNYLLKIRVVPAEEDKQP